MIKDAEVVARVESVVDNLHGAVHDAPLDARRGHMIVLSMSLSYCIRVMLAPFDQAFVPTRPANKPVLCDISAFSKSPDSACSSI
jgi:hypothetical protein